MSSALQYTIISTGGVVDGHEPEQVIAEFCTIFGVKEDRAAKYVAASKLIKKDLSEAQANAYRDRFMSIGLPVTVTPQDAPDEFGGMSLMPANEPVAIPGSNAVASGSNMSCPKCNTEQEQSVTCNSCGIIIEKYLAAQSDVNVTAGTAPKSDEPQNKAAAHKERASQRAMEKDSDGSTIAWLAVAVVIAIVGAFIWKYIAVSMDRELALAAWLIGAAIGGGAAALGAYEDSHGIICAGLLILAIAGGKYMSAGVFADEYQMFEGMEDEFASAIVDGYRYEAEAFASVGRDEQSIKEFMAEGIYTEAYDAANVTDDEYDVFINSTMPMLIQLHEEPDAPIDSDAIQSLLQPVMNGMGDISQAGIFKGMWGLLDILFIFLGAGSAYKLASGRGN